MLSATCTAVPRRLVTVTLPVLKHWTCFSSTPEFQVGFDNTHLKFDHLHVTLKMYPEEKFPKKPKRVVLSTNLTDDYQPKWGDREGVRELVQNWYDGILREYRLSGFQDIEIIKSCSRNGKSFQFDAFRRLQAPSPSRVRNGDRPVLGYIKFIDKAKDNKDIFGMGRSPVNTELILYNTGVQLNQRVLGMGVTDKRQTELDFIGGHGEGMKVGILALVRNEHEVLYFTAGERWKFDIASQYKWSDPELRVIITQNLAHNNTEGLRVTVKNLKQQALNDFFDGILFLHPPPSETVLQARNLAVAAHGCILTGDKYLQKLYCKSLFVFDYGKRARRGLSKEEGESCEESSDGNESDSGESEDGGASPARNGLHYGYNFLRGLKLGRDRDIPSSTDLTVLVSKLWMDLLTEEAEDVQANVSSASSNSSLERMAPLAIRFLDLFEQAPHCMDISDSRWYFGKKYGIYHADRVMRHLWVIYLSRQKNVHDGAKIWVYDHRKEDAEEQQKIIRSLGMTSVSPPDGLLNLFNDYKLARTPDEEQKKRFKDLDDTTSTSFEGSFSAHVRHLINVARDCQTEVRGYECCWKRTQDVNAKNSCLQDADTPAEHDHVAASKSPSFDLDIFISDNTIFLNDRNLSFNDVHSEGKGGSISCPALDSAHGNDVESVVCDCSVQDLVNQMVQDCNPKASKKQLSRRLRDINNMFLLLPRNLTFSFHSSESSRTCPVEVTLTWTTQMHDASNFVVELRPGEWSLQNTVTDPDISSSEATIGDNLLEALDSLDGQAMGIRETGDQYLPRENVPAQGYPDVDDQTICDEETRDQDLQPGVDAERTFVEQGGSESGANQNQSQATNRNEETNSIFLTVVGCSVILTNLEPEKTYTIQVFARRPTPVAYSLPSLLCCPLDRVHNLYAEASSEVVKISFDPVLNAVKYVVTLAFCDDHQEEFEIESTQWSHETGGGESRVESIAVVGMSAVGIRSYGACTAKPVYLTRPSTPTESNDMSEGIPVDAPVQSYHSDSEAESRTLLNGMGDDTARTSDPLDYPPFSMSTPPPFTCSPTSRSGEEVRSEFRSTYDDNMESDISDSSVPELDDDSDYVHESDVDEEEFDDDEGDWEPETVIESYQSHKVGVASQYEYHSLDSLDLHGEDITQGDLLEVRLRKSHATDGGRRFLHFLLFVHDIWERDKANSKSERVLQCHQYLSEHDFKNPSLAQDPTAYVPYRDLSANDREMLLILPSDGSEESEKKPLSVDINVDDIVEVISVFDEDHGRDPEGKTDGTFHCSWALGLRSRAGFLTPVVNDDDSSPPPTPPKPRELGVADFFCGAGGFSLGFSQVGWDIKLGVDSNIHACNTFKFNNPNADIHHAKVENLLTELKGHHIYNPPLSCAVALISPPCQGFSSANPGGKNDRENRKGLSLCSKIARKLSAHHILVENVPGLVRPKNMHHLHREMIAMKASGRRCDWRILNAADFGAPTSRKRVFMIASKVGLTAPLFPDPTHSDDGVPYVTVRDAIADLDIPNPRKDASVGNPFFLAPDRKVSRYALSMKATDTIEHHAISKADVTNWLIADWDSPSNTLRTACNDRWACVHPSGARKFSPREMARLMSFPDDYFFSGEVSEQLKQIGNAVCPIVSRAFGESFKTALLQDYPDLGSYFVPDDESTTDKDNGNEYPGKDQLACVNLNFSKRPLYGLDASDSDETSESESNRQRKRPRFGFGYL